MYNFEMINNSEIHRLEKIIEQEKAKESPDQNRLEKYQEYLEDARLYNKIVEYEESD